MDNAACPANNHIAPVLRSALMNSRRPTLGLTVPLPKRGCLIEQLYHAFGGVVINYFRFGNVRKYITAEGKFWLRSGLQNLRSRIGCVVARRIASWDRRLRSYRIDPPRDIDVQSMRMEQ